jgi:hypothetical protein
MNVVTGQYGDRLNPEAEAEARNQRNAEIAYRAFNQIGLVA